MSYETPTKWNDLDFAGVTLDWTSRTNKLPYPAYEMQRQAVLERYKGVNLTHDSSLDAPVTDKSVISSTKKTNINFLTFLGNYAQSDGADVQFIKYNLNAYYSVLQWYRGDGVRTALLAALGQAAFIAPGKLFSAAHEIQNYKCLNLAKWGKNYNSPQIGNTLATYDDTAKTIIFNHFVPYSYGSFPPHMWEIWLSETPTAGSGYGVPHKIYSEWIPTTMNEGDTHNSPTLNIADVFSYPNPSAAMVQVFSYYYEIFKYDYANDLGNGFQYYDWTPKEIPS